MRILITTPMRQNVLTGNRVTSHRCSVFLERLGHQVEVAAAYDNQRCDVLLALHARRSADSICRFRKRFSAAPILLMLTGTDLYGDIRDDAAAQRSLAIADRLILLQPDGIRFLPAECQSKSRVILQSAPTPKRVDPPLKTIFEVCVIGHLREVKDPFRAAMAARLLPDESRIRIVQIGAALDGTMRQQANREMEQNPRYRWLGAMSHGQTLRRLGRAGLLALTSKLEGGANVISEAIVAGTPVLSSRISGSIGLLGEKYPAFFETGDTQQLSALLFRLETDERFYKKVAHCCETLKPQFDPQREEVALRNLLDEF